MTSPAPILVTGAGGQLGHALGRRLGPRARLVTRAALDVADAQAVERALASDPPAAVLNTAAFTHVDRCEREPDEAERANGQAPRRLAEACARHRVKLVHVSTDYVFDGEADRPYTEDDPTGPSSVYGRTKLEGERAVLETDPDALVVRTSWVYGRGRNFPAAILGQAAKGAPLRVVDDQTGCPTRADELARGLLELLESDASGLYHLAGSGAATWWDLARAVLDHRGYGDRPLERIRTDDLDLDAPRPRYSVLDCQKAEAQGVSLRPWREALADHLESEDAPPRTAEENSNA